MQLSKSVSVGVQGQTHRHTNPLPYNRFAVGTSPHPTRRNSFPSHTIQYNSQVRVSPHKRRECPLAATVGSGIDPAEWRWKALDERRCWRRCHEPADRPPRCAVTTVLASANAQKEYTYTHTFQPIVRQRCGKIKGGGIPACEHHTHVRQREIPQAKKKKKQISTVVGEGCREEKIIIFFFFLRGRE